MGRFWSILVLLGVLVLPLQGCGGDDDGGSIGDAIVQEGDDDGGSVGSGGTEGPGKLGDLTDLGDLVAPDGEPPPGDGWYFTKTAAINNAGIVVGQSNAGSPVKGAFRWDPVTGLMTYLGRQSGTYDDFYGIGYKREEEFRKFFIYSEAAGINGSGTIIGNSTTGTGWPDDEEKRAFLWNDGAFFDLAPPPYTIEEKDEDENGNVTIKIYRVNGQYSEAVDINDLGEVALTMDDKTGRHAYYWDGVSFRTDSLHYYYPDKEHPTGPVEVLVPDVESLGRIVGADSEAVAINENGQAVINSGGTVIFHDLNWDVIESLNHLPGATMTVAVDINDSISTNNDDIPDGHVVGNSGNFDPATLDVATDDVRGFFWDGGVMYPIDDLGGGSSLAIDINNLDQVVGCATLEDGSNHAYIWSLDENKKGAIRDLGTLGGTNSCATAINEAGQVVGWSETGGTCEDCAEAIVRHAFLWDSGTMYDLGTHQPPYEYPFTPTFPFSAAAAINDSGEVAGNSVSINNHSRGFYLKPAFPESAE
ncbi:hypothetical protein [uncultured Desulfuromonas sp.]|uniref:hypothetical protein n=1 Tax=uncultured Desulfuromonas sp. TaxID=181013 RepID=UPI00261E3BBE|nr:hypothetical protein [uncultured Desulfuromonas sp.]